MEHVHTTSDIRRERNCNVDEDRSEPTETLDKMVEDHSLARQIAEILDECGLSHAVHTRKLKELIAIRSSAPTDCFFPSFVRALRPLFDLSRRTPSSERAVRFVAAFAARRDGKNNHGTDAFLEELLRFLLIGTKAAQRAARFRSCHIILEIIMRLPDDTEVSDEVWDEVIENMKHRLEDKVPTIRGFAVCALSRFAIDAENSNIVELFLKNLSQEQNPDVRKMIVLSLPPSIATSYSVVESTLDVSEAVRKAAYFVLGSKFPLQSLSIKLRTAVLQRGLSDRSPPVMKECIKMLKEQWFGKCCNQDPLALLRFLDVETYESVGEAVMDVLLKDGMVHVKEGQTIRQYLSKSDGSEGNCTSVIQLLEAEAALYWRKLCRHLQNEAQVKGSDAANTTGTEAVVYASEASEKNDLLETVLPETISDYVDLVRAHLLAGSAYRFVSRQLLLLGAMLDFSDSTNRKIASSFVQELLLRPIEFDLDDNGNKIVMGDGVSLGGDRYWARAVAELARRVYAAAGEFEASVTSVLKELLQPCRERTADFTQWMHCLAVAALLLENIRSLRDLYGKAIEPTELLHSLLIPGAKQAHLDLQRAATRCLCLFGLLEWRPSGDIVKQLRLLFTDGPALVSVMSCKALVDLITWHGPEVVDRAINLDPEHSVSDATKLGSPGSLNLEHNASTGVINLLYAAMEKDISPSTNQNEEDESLHSVLGEGFAKLLLWSEKYPSIPICYHHLLLRRLISLYFSDETKEMHRLTQCLSVFFEHYPVLLPKHKGCVSRAFVPVMRSMWPGVYGNPGGSPPSVFKRRKLAVQASRFMLQMMQMPMLSKEFEDEHSSDKSPRSSSLSSSSKLELDCGEDGLAIRIAAEVTNYTEKKTSAAKSYLAALCRIAVLIQFRSEEQEAIKCMRGLIHGMISAVSTDKELVRELNLMAARLRSLDLQPDQELPHDLASAIFEKLGLDGNLRFDPSAMPPVTPQPFSARAAPVRRRVRREPSDNDDDDDDVEDAAAATFHVPFTPSVVNSRSQRASKTAAMSRMTAKTKFEFSEDDDDDDDDDGDSSDLTSEGDSDEDDYGVAE
ncbi:condensin complex subunit 3 [Phalaenopsis equestris]|uniref:condensin complex subunit 3 n=1 Tax=Phalaenopsis equestris TaxID=78828 RepID=UPI0009E21C3E|nr:condensin complex subunit 3 [Phalaenopsis equestris]